MMRDRNISAFLVIFLVASVTPTVATLAVVTTATPAQAAEHVDLLDRGWSSASAPPGFNGDVRCLLSFDGALYAGGTFQGAGDAAMSQVGRWNGTTWSGLGEGLNHAVLCLASFRGDLVAGGMFDASGDREVSHIARWDGAEWVSLGEGLETTVTAVVEFDETLVAAVHGRCNRRNRDGICVGWDSMLLARFNGHRWESLVTEDLLDDLEPLGPARDLIVHHGLLYAAMPVRARGEDQSLIYPAVRLTDDGWVPAGPAVEEVPYGKRPYIRRFLVHDDRLVIAGLFPSVDHDTGGPSRLIAGDGADWTNLDPGFVGPLYALASTGGGLVVAGEIAPYGNRGGRTAGVAHWDGQTWTDLAPDSGGLIWALAAHRGTLFAGGEFVRIGGAAVWNLARQTGNGWAPAAEQDHIAIPSPVNALSTYQGTILAGDETGLRALGDGLWRGLGANPQTAPTYEPMPTLTLSKYAGFSGEFRYPLLEHGSRLLAFTGSGKLMAWDDKDGWRLEALAQIWWEGGTRWYNADITALGAWQDRLVVGGRFGRIDEVEAQNIALRVGDTWVPLGQGISFSCPSEDRDCYGYYQRSGLASRVRAMAELDGDLIVAGVFNRAGGKECLNIARWDGTQWHPLGAGLNDVVMDLAVIDGVLYAAGGFTADGAGHEAKHVAYWTGKRWSTLLGGTDAPVLCLEVYNGHLVAGGLFREAGHQPARHVAACDGWGWAPLGSGVNGAVNDLQVLGDDLYLGGEFTEAAGKAAFHVARWTEPAGAAELTGLSALRTESGAVLRWTVTALGVGHAGFHVDRRPNMGVGGRLTTELLTAGTEYTFTDPDPSPNRTEYDLVAVTRSGRESTVATLSVGAADRIPLVLQQNHPNPFRGGPAGQITRISFSIPIRGRVQVRVLDLQGREVTSLMDTQLPPGEYEVPWTGRDAQGRQVAAGVYFYRLETPAGDLVRKAVLLD